MQYSFDFRSKLGIAAAVLICALPLASTSANATMCGERDKLLGQLTKKYKETSRGLGLSTGNKVLELYTSPTGTWSVLLTDPQGRTCVIAVGEAWHDVAKTALGPEA